jgi:hypothetical protein
MMLKRLCRWWLLRRSILRKEDVVENDAKEVVQEEEDFEMEGYLEKNYVVEKDEIW